eukprot:jgi/Hompol1/3866/HPOL_003397-RA
MLTLIATTERRKQSTRALKPGMCIKCKLAKPQVLLKQARFCNPCFLDSFVSRFRTNILKAAVPDGTRLMVALSGGPSSRALLHVLADFCRIDPSNPHRHIKFPDFRVCYVDQSAVLGNNDSVQSIVDLCQQYGCELDIVPLEALFETQTMAILETTDWLDKRAAMLISEQRTAENLNRTAAIKRIFDDAHTTSSKEDLLNILTMHLLLQTSTKRECGALLLGDSANLIAVRVIANTSKGRGLSLPSDISDTDWFPGVHVLRPLRDALPKEIGIYNHLLHLDSIVHPTLTTMMPAKTSIDRLTEEFIYGLDQEFPATVTTVIRTAFKIKTEFSNRRICSMCEGPFDELDVFETIDASVASHILTNRQQEQRQKQDQEQEQEQTKALREKCGDVCDANASGSSCCGAQTTSNNPGGIDFFPLLCYACRNIARDIRQHSSKRAQKDVDITAISNVPSSASLLPAYMAVNAAQRVSREQMHSQIKHFLIDDDGDEDEE